MRVVEVEKSLVIVQVSEKERRRNFDTYEDYMNLKKKFGDTIKIVVEKEKK